jgi:hypothetical protein
MPPPFAAQEFFANLKNFTLHLGEKSAIISSLLEMQG